MSHPSAAASEQARTDERTALMDRLAQTQSEFERRALSAMAEPLLTTSLTMQQLKVLVLIAIEAGRATGHDLSTLLTVSVATMSGIIDRLADHDMVARSEDPTDRRVRRLSVTDQGSAVVRDLLSSNQSMPLPALQRLELADLRALVQGIQALDQAMRQLQDEKDADRTAPPA